MYSQNNEEAVILDYFKDRDGRFLDIGASNGRTFSNTLALAERGWRGVCVEPSPKMAKLLRAEHLRRPHVLCIEAAITPVDGRFKFFDVGEYVNSLDKEHAERWSKTLGPEHPVEEINVCGMTIETLFSSVGLTFDFINIDVEARNLAVFQQLRDTGIRSFPSCLCVEHDGHHDEIAASLAPLGFSTLLINQENIILAR